MDPLAEKYTYKSTFDYAENDPVNAIDLDGLEKQVVNPKSDNPNSIQNIEPIIPNAGNQTTISESKPQSNYIKERNSEASSEYELAKTQKDYFLIGGWLEQFHMANMYDVLDGNRDYFRRAEMGLFPSIELGLSATYAVPALKLSTYGASYATLQLVGRKSYNKYIYNGVSKFGNISLVSRFSGIPTGGGAYGYGLSTGEFYVGETKSFFARNANHTGWLFGTSSIQNRGLNITSKQFFNISGNVHRRVGEKFLYNSGTSKGYSFINKPSGFIKDVRYNNNIKRVINLYPNLLTF